MLAADAQGAAEYGPARQMRRGMAQLVDGRRLADGRVIQDAEKSDQDALRPASSRNRCCLPCRNSGRQLPRSRRPGQSTEMDRRPGETARQQNRRDHADDGRRRDAVPAWMYELTMTMRAATSILTAIGENPCKMPGKRI